MDIRDWGEAERGKGEKLLKGLRKIWKLLGHALAVPGRCPTTSSPAPPQLEEEPLPHRDRSLLPPLPGTHSNALLKGGDFVVGHLLPDGHIHVGDVAEEVDDPPAG